MFLKLRDYWKYGNKFCSAEIASVLGKEKFFTVIAKKKKDELSDFKFLEASSFSELSGKLTKHRHCYLTINTDKVLIKETELQENDQNVVSQAFPGLSLSEFYYQLCRTDAKCFVAVCRKDHVHQILKEAENHKITIIGINLGFRFLTNLIPSIKHNPILSSRYKFEIANQEILSFETSSEVNEISYQINDVQVESKYIIALSGLFNYFFEKNSHNSNLSHENFRLKNLHSQKVFFKKGLVIGLGILFASLLVNFFLFNSYFKERQDLQEKLVFFDSQKETTAIKVRELEFKEKIVDNILNSGTSKSSFYINRIVSNKPVSVIFNKIEYQPLARSIRPDKKIEYEYNYLTLSGESKNKEEFSKWIEILEALKWVKEVTILSYGSSNDMISHFELSIHIFDEAKE
jgi:hypothetical protein